jgi:serine/threonine protein kinase
MELCSMGSIEDVLNLIQKPLAENEICNIAKQALLGLEFLHQNNKMHRDIKPDNILLNERGEVKLGDKQEIRKVVWKQIETSLFLFFFSSL